MLWGKAKDLEDTKQDKDIPNQQYQYNSEKSTSCESDLEESLLPANKSPYGNEDEMNK